MALLGHVRMTFSGTIGASQTWSTGFGITGADEAVPDAATLDVLLASAVGFVKTWWAGAPTTINSIDTTFDRLRAVSYAPGSTKAAAAAELAINPILTGQGAHPLSPTFTSIVQSLRSNTPGRSGRGRMYVPATAVETPLHQFPLVVTDAIAANTSALFHGILGILPVRWIPAVCGKVGNFPITSVVVDSLPDVQHRREDKIGPLFRSVVPVGA